ncbi:MAG TPA: hypothetical protein VGX25_32950 [Actinophytocola sp.]|uniref:hypothetical protein n=1 Tax=Actinophytocola sp. TaxID=1872138 RepID=UPI002DDD25E6|nr:hypothetical protein [Actinophytocola sp.]HEV2784220.1 hypothetical protein [Actinophytocola sp.]
MTTLVIILVLVAVAVLAVATVPLVIRSTRRHQLAGRDGPRRPALGSPAQVWVARGERVLGELDATLAEHDVWPGVSADAAQVVAELRRTAGQVAELDHALAQLPDPDLPAAGRLRAARAALLARMSDAVAGLERARAEVVELIATAATSAVVADPGPVRELAGRLDGLREGLVEVRRLADPETGSGTS